jgi:hypothetical protein
MPDSPLLTPEALAASLRAVYDAWPSAGRSYEEVYGRAPIEHDDDMAEAMVSHRAFLAAHDPDAKADQYNAERHDGELASVSRDLLYDFAHWLIDGKDFLGLGGDDA